MYFIPKLKRLPSVETTSRGDSHDHVDESKVANPVSNPCQELLSYHTMFLLGVTEATTVCRFSVIALVICKQIYEPNPNKPVYKMEQDSPTEKAFKTCGRKKHADFTIFRIVNKRTLVVTEVKSGISLILDQSTSKMVSQ